MSKESRVVSENSTAANSSLIQRPFKPQLQSLRRALRSLDQERVHFRSDGVGTDGLLYKKGSVREIAP